MSDEKTPSITVNDIVQSRQVIDVAIERGAFKGNEITSVGKVRDNLAQYEEYQRKLQEENAEAQDTEESSGGSTNT